jgi:putative methionine-R-sulfoxide reductase with GAF domain
MEPLATKLGDASREPKPVTENHRKRVRHKVHTPAYASLNGNSGGMVLDLNEILDISQDGMAIQTSPPLEVNRTVSLCLDLSETKTYIHTTGHVIWSDETGRTGIRFADMPEASVSHLKEWLFLNAMAAGGSRGAAQNSKFQSKEAASTAGTLEPNALPEEHEFESPAPHDYTSILTALAAVKREVASIGGDMDAALQLVAERALTFMHATGAAIALSRGDEMVCVAAAGPDAPSPGARLQVGSGFSGECIRTGKLLRCDDTETDSHADREVCRVLGIRSIIAIPIHRDKTVIGLLEVFSSNADAFSENDSTILRQLADAAVAAVNRVAQPPVSSKSLEISGKPLQEFRSAIKAESIVPEWFSIRRTLPIAAAATLALVLLWTITPWVKSWIGGSGQRSSQKQSPPYQAPLRKPITSTADATDLGALRKLAEEGDPAAQFALGARYATGEGVSQNYSEAVRWFAKAGEQGHVVAQATLGAYYWAGRGVPQDLSKAYFWSILAQAGGDEASKYRVAVLASRMPHAQVVAAQEQANDWIKRHQLISGTPSSSP